MSSTFWRPLTEPLRMSREIVHVVRVDLNADDTRIDCLKSLLSPDESARADRFKVPLPRRHFIVCRATLRRLLGESLNRDPRDVEFDYGPHGKPALRQGADLPQRLEFSVSHSADQALIAMTIGRQLGVDLERMDSSVRILKLATRFFSQREADELNDLPEADQLAGFYRGWTSKESYIKATGLGLAFPLNKFSVSLNPHLPASLLEVVDQPTELNRWRLLSLDPLPGFAAAILFESQLTEQVTLEQWSAHRY
jgi:4'-phosphopantetheinyl transferase